MFSFTGPEPRIECNMKENKECIANRGDKCLLNMKNQVDSEMSGLF